MAKLYIIDDHAMFRDGLRAFLTPAGHEVIGDTGDLTEGLADLRRLKPELLLLDLVLGERSGFELLESMRRRSVQCRVVVMTMSNRPHHVAEALRWGVHGYILKGSRAADLLQAVAHVMAGERYFSPGVPDLAVSALSAPPEDQALASLSARERQVVAMVAQGMTSRRIAEQVHLSPKTIESYRSRIMAKLGMADLAALLRFALRAGLISKDDL